MRPGGAIGAVRSAVMLCGHREWGVRRIAVRATMGDHGGCVEALEAGVTQLDLELTRTVADHVAEITTRRHTMAFRVLAALAWGLLLVALTALVVR